MRTCPHCNGVLEEPNPYRNELERELGNVAKAAALIAEAKARHGTAASLIGGGFVAWRGMVWTRVKIRKAARCCLSGVDLAPGAIAWRQLSEVRWRDDRVAAAAWKDIAP